MSQDHSDGLLPEIRPDPTGTQPRTVSTAAAGKPPKGPPPDCLTFQSFAPNFLFISILPSSLMPSSSSLASSPSSNRHRCFAAFTGFKRQIYFILLKLFNTVYCFSPFLVRRLILSLLGCRIGQCSHIHSVRFFGFRNITLGSHVTINRGCYLDNRMPISIGNCVMIAHDSKLYTMGHDIDDPSFALKGAPIHIRDYVVIFANAMIMPGVTLHEGAVVLPGSIVIRDVPEYTVVGGSPAKAIRDRKRGLTYRPNYGYWFAP